MEEPHLSGRTEIVDIRRTGAGNILTLEGERSRTMGRFSFFWNPWLLRMEPKGCAELSVNINCSELRNIPEELKSCLPLRRSLKGREHNRFLKLYIFVEIRGSRNEEWWDGRVMRHTCGLWLIYF